MKRTIYYIAEGSLIFFLVTSFLASDPDWATPFAFVALMVQKFCYKPVWEEKQDGSLGSSNSEFSRLMPSPPPPPVRPLRGGDVVILISGGPNMLVSYFSMGNGWLCRWMDGEKLEWAYFKEETLKRVA